MVDIDNGMSESHTRMFPVSVAIIDCEFDFSIVAEYIVLGFAYSLELSLYTMNNLSNVTTNLFIPRGDEFKIEEN